MKHIDSLALVRPSGRLWRSVSLRSALILAALALLPSCSSPFAGPDQLDIGIANAAMNQPHQAAEASRAMAMRGASMGAPVRRLAPLAPLQPLY